LDCVTLLAEGEAWLDSKVLDANLDVVIIYVNLRIVYQLEQPPLALVGWLLSRERLLEGQKLARFDMAKLKFLTKVYGCLVTFVGSFFCQRLELFFVFSELDVACLGLSHVPIKSTLSPHSS